MLPNGTIEKWQTESGKDILFPETKIEFATQTRWRGGAPTICPNFGSIPTSGVYQDIYLPSHGLVRNCRIENGVPVEDNTATYQDGPTVDSDNWTKTNFAFAMPWQHEVTVAAKEESGEDTAAVLHHQISLTSKHNTDIPYSLGFHPYFATQGQDFTLQIADRVWKREIVPRDKLIYIPATLGSEFILKIEQRTITITLTGGYDGFVFWTDRPDLYICVEPVCMTSEQKHHLLPAGESITCSSTITFTESRDII